MFRDLLRFEWLSIGALVLGCHAYLGAWLARSGLMVPVLCGVVYGIAMHGWLGGKRREEERTQQFDR